jgi:Kef-type K+ transport system membrane component KefB
VVRAGNGLGVPDAAPGRTVLRRRIAAGAAVAAAVVLAFALADPGSTVHQADPVARFLLAVALIITVSHLLGWLAGRLRQPPVIGEVLGGILLGPSALATWWPEVTGWLFTDEVVSALNMVAQLGLVVFMFLLGSELRLGGAATGRPAVTLVLVGSIVPPFLGGAGLALAGSGLFAGAAGDRAAYVVFFGLALAITALPVLARVLVDMKMETTRIGMLALACAAAGDGLMWAVLTLVLGLSGPGRITVTLTACAVLALVLFLVVRPALRTLAARAARNGEGHQFLLPVLLGGALACATVTHLIGLHPAIGAFLFGTMAPRDSIPVERLNHRLQGFVLAVLLPLLFAGVGLVTSVGLLGTSPARWGLFGAVLFVAMAGKIAGTAAGARAARLGRRDGLRLGALMNCRGVTELVVAAIGYQYGLINAFALTVLVLVALITTAAAGPLMHLAGVPSSGPAILFGDPAGASPFGSSPYSGGAPLSGHRALHLDRLGSFDRRAFTAVQGQQLREAVAELPVRPQVRHLQQPGVHELLHQVFHRRGGHAEQFRHLARMRLRDPRLAQAPVHCRRLGGQPPVAAFEGAA